MEKTTDSGERTGNVEEEIVVKSVAKDVLVADIPDIPVEETKDEENLLVMVGAEIIDTVNELAKEPREGSGLVSVPTVLEKELQELLKENSTVEEKVGLEAPEKKDRSMGDELVTTQNAEGVEDKKQTTEKKADCEEKVKTEKVDGEKEKNVDDGGKKEKKGKKDKEEKKKEKKEKKSKKSDVERIRKKLEKIESKILRIYAKKDEYLKRLQEAQEKERQEKERLAVEGARKEERDLATSSKSSAGRNADALSEEARDDEEAVVKQVESSQQSSAKEPDELISAPISVSNTNTSEKQVSIPGDTQPKEKDISDQS